MGETRVDLLHLLEDLRDAYAGAVEESILTEVVANALDSGAGLIRIGTDPALSTLTVVDDGAGMPRRDLRRYHDIATSTKIRGEGIGFAGVGIKLALLVGEEVCTETRRGKSHVASSWRLASRHRAPWRWVPPPELVSTRGTAVRLRLGNALSPLLDPGFIEGVLLRHFEALLDPGFDDILRDHYRRGVRFEINGLALSGPGADAAGERAPIEVRLGRRRKPAAHGYLLRSALPLPESRRGLAISTLGKTIKRGWDWLGVTPSTPDRIAGLIEAPMLAGSLTLNKADFLRTGERGATYLAFRKAIQEAVARQLATWGDAPDPEDAGRRRAARPVERDLERVLIDLADDFPLLRALVEQRRGGQGRLPMDGRGAGAHEEKAAGAAETGAGAIPGAAPLLDLAAGGGPAPGATDGPPPAPEAAPEPEPPAGAEGAPVPPPPRIEEAAGASGRGGATRPGRYGLAIQFEERPGDPELGRLVESTVWVNASHPAYLRAVASRSEGYHLALTVALALAPLAVESAREHAFLTTFLDRWGGALGPPRRRARRRR